MSSNPHGSTAGLVPLKKKPKKVVKYHNVASGHKNSIHLTIYSLDYDILTMDLH